MNSLFLPLIASILAFSTIYGSISHRFDGEANSVLLDFTEKSEGEIEAIDIRLFINQLIPEELSDWSTDLMTISYSEKLTFVNCLEVPIPPPKG